MLRYLVLATLALSLLASPASAARHTSLRVVKTGPTRFTIEGGRQQIHIDTVRDLPRSVRPYGSTNPQETFGASREVLLIDSHSERGLVAFSTGHDVHGSLSKIDVNANPVAVTPLDLYYEGDVTALKFSPSGLLLASSASSQRPSTALYVWDTTSWERRLVGRLDGDDQSVKFHWSGERLHVLDRQGHLRLEIQP